MNVTRPWKTWPSGDGWTIGILSLSPADLADRCGLQFSRGRDDLDSYSIAALQDPQVGQIWLFRHEHSPSSGTEVVVDSEVSRDAAISALRRQAGFTRRAFEWITAQRSSGAASKPVRSTG